MALNSSSPDVASRQSLEPRSPASPSSTGADLWQSIQTIISLQNQAPPLVEVNREEEIPASFTQERLWLLDQLTPGTTAYNIPFAFQITGQLDIAALEHSLQALLQRHEALRITFDAVAGKPIQVIHPFSTALVVIDLQSLADGERQQQAQQLVEQEAQQGFDLQQGPLFRSKLLQLAADDFILILNVHHIVFDGWSEGILFQELATYYNAAVSGEPPALKSLPVQYADFASWQRQWLQGEFLEALQTYWQQQLAGDLQELPLPCDRPYAEGQKTRRSAVQKFVLSKDLSLALKTLSRQERTTLFPTLLAALQLLLHFYTEQDDLVVCSPTANRNRSELKGLIGYFVNLLVLRCDLSGDPSFKEFLAQVRQVTSGASAHQDLPIQQLVNCLEGGQVPVSQVLFAFQNMPRQSLTLSNVEVQPLDVDGGTADFDLFLSIIEDAGILNGILKYNADLFDHSTIEHFIRHFQTLLENIVSHPEQPLSLLMPLSQAECQQLRHKRLENFTKSAKLAAPTSAYEAPRNAMELQLSQLWQELLKVPQIGIRDNFFELGGQSLLALSLFAKIEQQFGKNLPLATLFQAPTIAQLAEVLRQEKSLTCWDCLVPIQTSGSNSPFFCVHGLGGHVLEFWDLGRHLAPDQPFYAIQALGLNPDKQPHQSIPEMAAYYLTEMRTVQPHGPYFLGGYSFGGIVAFEMAQQLQAAGETVALLAMLDRPGPHLQSSPTFAEHLRALKYNLSQFQHWHEKVAFLWYRLSEKWTPFYRKWHNVLMSQVLRRQIARPVKTPEHAVKRANWLALKDYKLEVYPGKLTLFKAKINLTQAHRDRFFGWQGMAEQGIEIYDVSGDHSTMIREPHVQRFALELKQCIHHASHPNHANSTHTSSNI